MNNQDIIIGKNIRRLREARNMSRRELGALIGCSIYQIIKYEMGRDSVKARGLPKLQKALKIKSKEEFYCE